VQEFLALTLLITFVISVTGLLLAGVVHFAVAKEDPQRGVFGRKRVG
jgi:hypothetical protein